MKEEGKKKKSLLKRWWFWLIIVVIAFAVIGGSGDKDTDVDQPANTAQTETETNQSPTEATKEEDKVKGFKPGTYKVGTDMPAGEYKLFAQYDLAYFELTKDSSGSFDSILANDNFPNYSYLTVEDGQYIKIQHAIAVPIDNAPKSEPQDGVLPSGTYKVGFDIDPGEYKVTADGLGYIQVDMNSKHTFEGIITNDNFEGDKYITVKEGQYLKLQNAFIKVN